MKNDHDFSGKLANDFAQGDEEEFLSSSIASGARDEAADDSVDGENAIKTSEGVYGAEEDSPSLYSSNFEEVFDVATVEQNGLNRMAGANEMPREGSLTEGPVHEEGRGLAQEDESAAVNPRNGSALPVGTIPRRSPGVMFVPGPDFDPERERENIIDADVDRVIEAYVPMTANQLAKQRRKQIIRNLLENAITLDDAAITPIQDDNVQIEETAGDVDGRIEKMYFGFDLDTFRKLCCALMTLLAAVGITIGAALGSRQNSNTAPNSSKLASSVFLDEEFCGFDTIAIDGSVENRLILARDIVSEITPIEILENSSSHQSSALAWIVCNDTVSSNLLNNPDSSGKLPNQTNGFVFSGNAGETQVQRRYILALFYFATSQDGPWKDKGDFMDPELHECSWYKNFTRQNCPFNDYDPTGFVCQGDYDQDILRDDFERKVQKVTINFRVANNLTGTIPTEFGHLTDVESILIESHRDMAGSIPHSIGNMTNLATCSFLFMGPNFGGEIPESLFKIKTLKHVAFKYNEGSDWKLPVNVGFDDDSVLNTADLFFSGFSGTIPNWLSQFKTLVSLDLAGNNFSGGIPEEFQYFPSLEYLGLFGNRINSTLPSSLGKIRTLRALVLGDNNIEGSIPHSIGNLSQLDLLHLGGNKMSSTIPQSFADMSNLKSLVLSSNFFNGTIDVLESMNQLSLLLIHENRFSGTIPKKLFSQSPHEKYADFGNNLFHGILPPDFGDLENFVYLAATQNAFDAKSVDDKICNNTTIIMMDCSTCGCCDGCCEDGNDYCTFHPDEYILTGLECGMWYNVCGDIDYDAVPTED